MTRQYEQRKRAENQLETRRRIVEAAIQLHASKGPASTTVSDVARVAGVQRHTVYRHFPDEMSLGLACSGLYSERNPPPDPEGWRMLQGEERLRRALSDLYAYFERNRSMLSCVVRDAETDELTRELVSLRFGGAMGRIRRSLAQAIPRRKAALATLDLALNFRTWEGLHGGGLSNEAAAEAMVRALLAQ
jgi:AcrR family transcriptional regulator